MADQALAHLKVLDLSHDLAGPYCSKLLAGLGAEIIKVERPGRGDGARRLGPFVGNNPNPEKSLVFLYLNAGKKSITLDLKSALGKRIFRHLVRDADSLVENFSPRVLPGLGLGYEALREENPKLICTSISNFGQSGPYRDYKAQDIVEYAMSGLMYTIGAYEREPLKHGLAQAQLIAGATAAVGTLSALAGRWVSGSGQQVDVSIQEPASRALLNWGMWYAYSGAIWRRARKDRKSALMMH